MVQGLRRFGVYIVQIALLATLPVAAAAVRPAERLLYAGNLGEGLPAAQGEAEAAPSDLDAQERYIDSLLSMGLLGAADAVYRARVEASPTADSWYLFGRVLIVPEEAVRAYQIALESDPGHSRSHMGLGAVYRATGRFDEAETEYKITLEHDQTLTEARSGLVATQLALERSGDALTTAHLAIEAVPNDPDAYLAVAALAPQDSVDVLSVAAVRASADPRVHAALAEAHLDRGNGQGALVASEHALLVSPSFIDPALSLLFAKEMVAETLDADGYHGLLSGRLIEDEDDFAALAHYDALVGNYAGSSLPLMARARVLSRQGNTERAISDLAAAVGLDPSNQEAQAALGILLLEAGRIEESVTVLERVVERREGDATLALALSRSHEAAGNRPAALQTLATVRRTRPLHVEAALHHARLLSEGGDSQAAYEVLLTVAGELPDARIVLGLAAAAVDVGKTSEAADLLGMIAASTGNDAFATMAERLRAN